MFQIELQFVAAILLAIVAIRLQVSLHRRRKRDWQSILKEFRDGHGHLIDIGNCLRDSKADIWSTIGGVTELYRMYMNMEILLEAINYAAKKDVRSSDIEERIQQLRKNTANAQVLIALLALKRITIPTRNLPLSAVRPAIESYLASVNGLGLLLNDHYPTLRRFYRYFVSRQVSQQGDSSQTMNVSYEGISE